VGDGVKPGQPDGVECGSDVRQSVSCGRRFSLSASAAGDDNGDTHESRNADPASYPA
jgi:hypothetical protein